MAKRKQTKRKQTATQKLRKLVQQQVRRMEKRGYRINSELKEKIKTGKYQTLQSIRRNKYAKLYEGASAEIDTKIVPGSKYREYERSESAKRGALTRQRKKIERSQPKQEELNDTLRIETEPDYGYDEPLEDEDYGYDEDYTEWQEQRKQLDTQERQFANSVDQGKVMYENITNLIDKFPRAGADILNKALASEINKYGLDMVMVGMAQAPIDVVETAQKIVHYLGTSETIHTALTNLFDAITGTIRSIQDSMDIGTAMDVMTDMGTT